MGAVGKAGREWVQLALILSSLCPKMVFVGNVRKVWEDGLWTEVMRYKHFIVNGLGLNIYQIKILFSFI